MQFFCDVEKPDGAAFSGNCRGFLRDVNRNSKAGAYLQRGYRVRVLSV